MDKKRKAVQVENDKWEAISILGNPYSWTGAFPPDKSRLQRRIAKNPIGAALECAQQVQRIHDSFRDELYGGLQFAYAIARHFSTDFKAFKEFYALPFFRNSKRKFKASKQHKHSLRHVMNFVFNATSEVARKRTGKYAAALGGYMKQGMPAHIVAQQIKADGGIEKLYEISVETALARPKRHRSLSEGPAPDFLLDDEPVHMGGKARKTPAQDWSLDGLEGDSSGRPGNSSDGDFEDEVDDKLLLGSESGAEAVLMLKRGRDPSERETVELEVPARMKKWLLGLKKGERAVLRIKCEGVDERDEGEVEWVRLRAKHVFQWPSARSRLLMQ